MANCRFTCEAKSLSKCTQPKSEFSLPDFKGVKCDFCYGVVSYEKILSEKIRPKKVKAPEKVNKIEAPKEVEAEIKVHQEAPQKEVKPKEVEDAVVVDQSQEMLASVKKMVEAKEELVKILVFLKDQYGLTSKEAASFYKENFPLNEPSAEQVQEEPVKIPVPLPEAEAKQKEESPVKAPKPSVEVSKIFPITKVNFIDDTSTYHFFLVTEDGIEFQINVKAAPEKYANAKKHPQVFNNANIELKYSETDPTEIPINPTVVRLVVG